MYSKYIPKSIVPAGRSGDYEVVKFTISNEDAENYNLGLIFSWVSERAVKPGDYTKLVKHDPNRPGKGWLLMSDTPAEVSDHLCLYYCAEGDVLINGLGLGLIARALLLKEEVNSVTINEISDDVIKLSAPTLKNEFGDRVKINHIDAFKYHPNGNRFNTIWHDIWDTICADNIEQYKKLMRRYKNWGKKPFNQLAWAYDYLKDRRMW